MQSEPPREPLFLRALISPRACGFPTDPRLKIPAVVWISRDPSPEAQRLAQEIWATIPPELQAECRETLGLDL
jgi:hypothetical protein